MTDLFERGGHIRLSWQDRFKDKWPYMTTLMYQNDGSNLDNLTNGPNVGQSVSVENLQRETGWPHHQQDVWSDRRILDHNKVESDVSSSSSKQKKGCYKACNIALCVFLIITIVTAACAGIGLAILLNGGEEDDFASYEQTHGDNHLNGFLSPTEEIYLSKQFCDLIKVLMKSTRYPVKDGIDHCYAVLKLIRGSEELHIEMHVQPTSKYTMKEKLRRALRERKLAEGSYRINGTNTCLKTTPGIPSFPCDSEQKNTGTDRQVPVNTHNLPVDENYFRKDFQSIKQTPVVTSLSSIESISELPISSQSSYFITDSFSATRLGSTSTPLIPKIFPSLSIESSYVAPGLSVFSSNISISTDQSNMLETSFNVTHTLDRSTILDTTTELHARQLSKSYSNVAMNNSPQKVSNSLYTSVILPSETYQIQPTETAMRRPSDSIVNTVSSVKLSSSGLYAIRPSNVEEESLETSFMIQPSSSFKSSDVSAGILSSVHHLEVSKEISFSQTNFDDSESITSTPLLVTSMSDSVATSINVFDTQSVTSSSSINLSPSISKQQEDIPFKIYKPKPFQTIAKTQIQIAPKLNEFQHKDDTSTLSNVESTTVRVPRVVENLMLGGVVKLPFKTTSRFRFLFANSPNRQAVSPTVVRKQKVNMPRVRPASSTSAYNFTIVKNRGVARVRFTPTSSYTDQNLVRHNMPRVLRQQSAITRNKTPPPIFSGSSGGTQRKSQTLARFFSGGNYMNGIQGRGR